MTREKRGEEVEVEKGAARSRGGLCSKEWIEEQSVNIHYAHVCEDTNKQQSSECECACASFAAWWPSLGNR